jgi:hypothetical protein
MYAESNETVAFYTECCRSRAGRGRGSSLTLGKMKPAPHFSTMHSGNLSIVLEDGIDYDSFPSAAERWARKLALRVVNKVDGPDARLWECEKDGKKFCLVFDDWFPEINLEPQDAEASAEIPRIGREIGVDEKPA